MKVILKENVDNLGKTGDVVNVSEGYARNFLLPRNMIVVANENNMKEIEHHKKALAKKREKDRADAEVILKKLEAFSCTIARKVSENEKIFGSVTAGDIATVLNKNGFDSITRSQVQLHDPIKQLGVFTIGVRLQPETIAQLKVWVVQEGQA